MDWFENLVLPVLMGAILLVVIAAFGLIAAIPTYFLWNWLMPAIFGLKVITFWQAWGIVFLSGILFKGSSTKTTEKNR